MTELPKPIEHQDADKKDDEALRLEAAAYLAKAPALQVIAEIVSTLRASAPPWWTPEALRVAHSAATRMEWLRQRPDLRQKITTAMTGLTPKIARRKPPQFQSALIDSALDEGDITTGAFEEAFEPSDLAVYGAADHLWRTFRARMPWTDNSPAQRELVGNLLKVLLADKSPHDGVSRKPIVSAWDVRTSIPSTVWHARIPAEILAAIDDARFKREKSNPREPFHAGHDLAIAKPDIIARHINIKDLESIFECAEKQMGIGPARTPEAQPAGEASASPTRSRRGSTPPAKPASVAAGAAPPLPTSTVAPQTTNGPPPAPSSGAVAAVSGAPPLPTARASSQSHHAIPTPVPNEWTAEASTSNGPKSERNDGSVDLMVDFEEPPEAPAQNPVGGSPSVA